MRRWERNAMRNVGLRTASDAQKETRNHERICQESQLVHDQNRDLSRNALDEMMRTQLGRQTTVRLASGQQTNKLYRQG